MDYLLSLGHPRRPGTVIDLLVNMWCMNSRYFPKEADRMIITGQVQYESTWALFVSLLVSKLSLNIWSIQKYLFHTVAIY